MQQIAGTATADDMASSSPVLAGVHHLVAAQPPVAGLSEGGLEDRLIDLEQSVNALRAVQAQVIAELDTRAHTEDAAAAAYPMDGLVPVVAFTRSEFVVDHIAALLSCTKTAASRRYSTATAAAMLPALMAAWAAGRIDEQKTAVIADQVTAGDPACADALAGQAADYATTRTGPEVRRWLARRVLRADPATAERRRRRASADRRVTYHPLPDGMAELAALLPAVQARQLFDTLTACAHAAAPDDPRTTNQRRSDALIDLVAGRADPPQVNIGVVVPIDTLLGESSEPGHLTGYGPITADQARALAGLPPDGTCLCGCPTTHHPARDGDPVSADGPAGADGHAVVFRRLLTDPDTGTLLDLAEQQYRPSRRLDRAIRTRDMVCRFPGCNRPATTTASGTDLDHTTPWPAGPTSAGNLAVLCRHHHRLKHSPSWACHHHPDGTMTWTTPGGRTLDTHPWSHADPPDPGPDPPPD